MLPISVEVIITENQECRLPLPAAAIQSAPERQVRRDRNCRFLNAFTARRKRSGRPAVLAALLLATSGAWAQNGVFNTLQPVGVISSAQSVTVTAQTAGTVATVEVLTLGKSGLDFAGVSSSSTCLSAILTSSPPQACTESVTFTPAFPGLRRGAVVLLDSNNNVLGIAYLSGTGMGGLGVLVPGNVITVAGVYRNWTSTQDGVLATQANLDQPSSLAFDGAGNLYIADSAHNRIRKVAAPIPPATAGIITTIAGTGVADYTGDGQSASAATLSSPSGVALDGAGNLYIADTGNNVIRKITAATGDITTVAGNVNGTAGYAGDGGLATSAELDLPQGITVDGSGNLYIADTANQRIRKVTAPVPPTVAGIISTVAGDGDVSGIGDGKGTYSGDGGSAINAGLSLPHAVAFDLAGNMYIPDSANNVIRMVASVGGAITPASTISTVVGYYPGTAGNSGDGGPATAAHMNAPSGVTLDAAGDLYIADTQNTRIRKVNGGNIATLVANGAGTNLSPGGTIPAAAQIYAPLGLFLDGNGNLYFADYFYMLIEEIQSNEAILNYTQTPVQVGNQSAPQTQKVENDGNAALTLTAFTPDSNAALAQGTSACSLITPLAVDADCLIYAVFAPSLNTVFLPGEASEPLEGNIDVFGNTISYPLNTVNFPLDIVLVGDATPVNATTLTLISNSPKDASGDYDSSYGQLVTFTATVTSGAGEGTPTGTVTFKDGATVLGSPVTLNSSGVATDSTATLAVGSHTITASYTPSTSSNYLPSPPATLIQNIGEVTATSLTSSGSPSVLGASVTFTATVSISGGGSVTPDGTVTFTDTTTGTILGSQTLGPSGIVTLPTTALTYGPHTITATFSGDAANNILGSSATLSQDVQAPSTIMLNSSLNPANYGNSVTFTVTVPTIGTVAATGTVNILETGQANAIGTVNLVAGTGTFSISSLAVGMDVITASYPGNLYYGPSTSLPVNQAVNQAVTSTVVNAIPNPGIAGAPVAITATVTVTLGVSTPTGSVAFTDGGASLGSVALNSGTGKATINPMLALGSHSIVATYSGDTNDSGSASASLPLTVNQANTTTVLASSGSPSLVLAPVTFTATVASIGGGVPSGNVTFTDTFNSATVTLSCAGSLTAGLATCTTSTLAAGTHTITATYGGDTNDALSSSTLSQVVATIPTLTGLGSSTTTGANPQVILVATVINYSTTTQNASSLPTPTGTVTFSTVNGSTLTLIGSSPVDSSGVATFIPASLPPGTFSIVAAYSGDLYHSPSTSVATSISNPAYGFTLTVTPASVSVATTQNVTVTVTLASISGFTDTIGLGCASLPAGVNCHFSTPAITLPATGVQNVQLTIDTNNPLGGGSSALNARPGVQGVSLAGLFLPLSVLFGIFFWRFRRRHAAAMTAALVLLLGSAALLVTGCSGFSQSSATPGTYVIQVTGVGANSDITHYQDVTLTITQ